MSTNINKFQSRLDAISEVEVVLNVNAHAYEIPWYELKIKAKDKRLTSGALTYTQYDNVFAKQPSGRGYSFVGVSEDGVIVNAYMHDGSNKIGRGYRGDSFELTMQDGSHKVISGPWSGRPSVHTYNSGIEYIDASVNGESIGLSKEFVQAIIDHFNLDIRIQYIPYERNPELWWLNDEYEQEIDIRLIKKECSTY